MRYVILSSVSVLALAFGAFSSSASAQTAASEPDAAASLDDVVVTARRSSERVQSIPLTINAQTSEQLEARGITDLQGISRYTPGLQFKDYVTTFNGSATIRGLAQTNIQNAVGNVGTFIDGIYLQRGYLVNTSLGDWARIEVVKGPQSALYGANTFSGAINYVTHEADDVLTANASATIGDAGSSISAALGGPIIEGILAGRVFIAKSEYDGTWDNNLPGVTGISSKFGASERDAYSVALKLTPNTSFDASLYYTEVNRTEYLRPYYQIDGVFVEDKLNCGPISAATGRPSMFCGTFSTDPSVYRSGVGNRPADLFSAEQSPAISETQLLRGAANWQLNDAFSIHYLYGFVRGEAQEDFSFASNNFNPTGRATITQQHEGGRLEYISHDIRLAYDNGGAFKGDIGYFNSTTEDRFVFGNRTVTPGRLLLRTTTDPIDMTGRNTFTNSDATYDIEAVFARGSFSFLDDRAKLSAEARFSTTDIVYNDILGRTAVPSRPLLTSSTDAFTPRATLEFKLAPDNLIYASAARGVKAGGFNGYVVSTTVLTLAEQTWDPESNWTYEIGSKNSFLDRRLTLNAGLFYVDWTDKQARARPVNYTAPITPGVTPPSIYRAVGNATAYGVEVDGQFRPIPELQLTFSANYTKSEYQEGSFGLDYLGLCNGIFCPLDASVQGNQIEGAPSFSSAFGAEWRNHLTGDWDYYVGGDVTYQNKQYQDAMNLISIDGYALVDGRVGIDNGTWRAFVWAKNLLDETYIQNAFGTLSLRQYSPSFGEKRTVGLTVSASF